MATQAVKFYSVASLPQTPNNGALYFVNGGDLYKGTQRFGANKVYTASAELVAGTITLEAYTSSLTDKISGDILIGYKGAKVWDGQAWQDLSADVSSIIASISDSTASGTDNGITVGVTTSDGYVTGVTVSASEITGVSLVSAATGYFTDLNVDNKATFTATTVEASELTLNGTPITVLSGAISASTGTGIVNEGQVVNYVSAQLESFGNVIHFKGVVNDLPASGASGDIVVIGGDNIAPSLTAGQEYIWDGEKWEKIGDQTVPVGGTGTSTMNGVTVAVLNASKTAAPTVSITGVGTAAAKDISDTITAESETLPTGKAVATYVSNAISAAELVWLDEKDDPIGA